MNSTDQIIQNAATMQAFKEKLVAAGEEYGKGLGEVYALGYLSSLVENLMAKYPEVKTEIESALQQA